MATEGPGSPVATEMPVAHKQFTRDFKGRAGADTDAGKRHHSCSNRARYGQGWAANHSSYAVSVSVSPVVAQNRLAWFQPCLPQGWQMYKADTWEQEPLHPARWSLPFKQVGAFRQILKNKPNQCNYRFLLTCNSLVIPFSSHEWHHYQKLLPEDLDWNQLCNHINGSLCRCRSRV